MDRHTLIPYETLARWMYELAFKNTGHNHQLHVPYHSTLVESVPCILLMPNSSFEHMTCIHLSIMDQIVTSKITTTINLCSPSCITPEIEINETELHCRQNIIA